jgi:FAD/FMN-containing dehydrogenase
MSAITLPVTIGPVFSPEDDGYDDERAGYNQIVDHHPALIVGAACTSDVVAAVRYASAHHLPVAVQATGHGVSVPADGAVLINTSRMTAVHIDPSNRTAQFAAGVTGKRLVHEAARHGLAPLNGSAPDVGATSYMLGGGIGILGRKYGYAADHVHRLEVVTADGELRTITAAQDSDLFWALRGGKGNFGVVVSTEVSLMPVEQIYGGGLWFGPEHTATVLHAYSDWVDTLPDEMGSSVLLIALPDIAGIPCEIRGRYIAHLRIAYAGPKADGEPFVAAMRSVAPALLDTVTEMPYSAVGTIHNEPTESVPFYARNTILERFDHDAVEALNSVAGPDAHAPCLVELRHLDGAFSRPPSVPNAVGRGGKFTLYTGSVVTDNALGAIRDAHRHIHHTMHPYSNGRVAVNFLTGPDVTVNELQTGYRTEDFTRLTHIKHRYDPTNIFRINHNIPAHADSPHFPDSSWSK